MVFEADFNLKKFELNQLHAGVQHIPAQLKTERVKPFIWLISFQNHQDSGARGRLR
jgi:hypothetical protein